MIAVTGLDILLWETSGPAVLAGPDFFSDA
jgi:hypothetical protein